MTFQVEQKFVMLVLLDFAVLILSVPKLNATVRTNSYIFQNHNFLFPHTFSHKTYFRNSILFRSNYVSTSPCEPFQVKNCSVQISMEKEYIDMRLNGSNKTKLQSRIPIEISISSRISKILYASCHQKLSLNLINPSFRLGKKQMQAGPNGPKIGFAEKT